MRSEKDQMTGGREESVVEIQLRDIPRGQDAVSVNSKQKEEKKEVFTKVVIRRLPPNLSKDQLEEQLSPLPSYDYFEFFPADQSLYPHLFSRVYINFRNSEDILLFRDRFDGYVFIDNKGVWSLIFHETRGLSFYSHRCHDPEYRRFLENYSCDEEKSMANPETLLGEIEAKTKKLIAKRTTPLLEYIKNKKLEKHRIREEKREERRRRELEKKRQREEEKRKRREEERRKRKEADKQKKLSEKEIKIKLLKKSDRDDDVDSDRLKDKGDSGDTERAKWDKPSGHMKSKETKDQGQMESDKEQREHGRRQRDKDHRGRDEERKRQRHHYEFDKSMRCKEDTKWGKGYCQDRAKKDGQYHSSYSYCPDTCDKVVREDIGGSRKDRVRNKVSDKACVSQSVLAYQDRRTSQSEGPHQIGGALPNKDRPAMQLYQPGAHNRKRVSSAMRGYELPMNQSPEHAVADRCYEAVAMETGSEICGEE
ncbi:regulator of nonsense transcripts 3A isoform X4 [Salvelinus fontinalis]|uniref:regulator of nonsense transcripts 3A isoform X4 n=1 Tax=Salvelinus fontinalis TaxID=8038 RepID=UPI0024853FDE|nr:regulator of nonsense transcripts 3A isoform X4 [Salvelinus fontinalis]